VIIKHLAVTKLAWLLLVPVLALTGCHETAPSGPTTDLIVVTEFAKSQGTVTLDSSFGFSLYRGSPGVPAQQRATSIASAVAFLVSDTITQRLREAGYDSASTTDPNPQIPGRALIVSGSFREINEGHRRQVGAEESSVVADVQVVATGPGGNPRPVLTLHLDSRALPPGRVASALSRHETGVNADATRVGDAIARSVIDLARRNNWTIASH
jgi:hypothetical protein